MLCGYFRLHYMAKHFWTLDHTYVCWATNSKNIGINSESALLCHYNSHHSSRKAFHKSLSVCLWKYLPVWPNKHLCDQVLMLDEKTRLSVGVPIHPKRCPGKASGIPQHQVFKEPTCE